MRKLYRIRRMVLLLIVLVGIAVAVTRSPELYQPVQPPAQTAEQPVLARGQAVDTLATLPVKGRAAKTGYERTMFGDGWLRQNGCDMRNVILNRDMTNVAVGPDCKVQSGTLNDPYTGSVKLFTRGPETSDDVQIDHVVALSDAWQKGAQQLSMTERIALANDPLELLAVDGDANQQKSNGDAATWLPDNKVFRCQYVARQIAVKAKYRLWVTVAERDAMQTVLVQCPGQLLPVE